MDLPGTLIRFTETLQAIQISLADHVPRTLGILLHVIAHHLPIDQKMLGGINSTTIRLLMGIDLVLEGAARGWELTQVTRNGIVKSVPKKRLGENLVLGDWYR